MPSLFPQPRRASLEAGHCPMTENVPYAIDPATVPAQGYRISLTPQGSRIIAHDRAGEFYARQTLSQLNGDFVGQIEDWPDFPVRGVMLDISRDKVPTMRTLFDLVDLLGKWKINQLQLYTEHTFAYARHRTVWERASPLSGDEIRELDEYCRQRFIELVPNQNSLGHMERWLKHAEYAHLAEAADGAETPWGFRWKGPFSLCPTDRRSVELLAGMYAELLPNFTSRLFNVGCDETFDIGQGRSKEECDSRGVTVVYLDFLRQIRDLAAVHGRAIQFWGDVILRHPEMISRIPPGVTALQWGYEADHPFDAEGKLFGEAGVPFYVCPGTSSWLSIAGRTDNMLANLRSAAENGLKHGAIGYLNTDWGDHGHLQYLPVSYAGFAAGAAFSWCLASNRDIDLARVLTDHAGINGPLAFDLGNVYKSIGKLTKNSSALVRILIPSSTHLDPMDGITMEGIESAESAIAVAMKGPLSDEFLNAAAMLKHACRRAKWKLRPTEPDRQWLADDMRQIIAEHRRLWLQRNRPGGLDDSTARLSANLAEYESAG